MSALHLSQHPDPHAAWAGSVAQAERESDDLRALIASTTSDTLRALLMLYRTADVSSLVWVTGDRLAEAEDATEGIPSAAEDLVDELRGSIAYVRGA